MYINWFRIGTKYPGFCDFCPEVSTEVSWRVSAGLRRLPVPLSLNTHPYPFCFLPLRITKLKPHPSHLAAQSLGVSFSSYSTGSKPPFFSPRVNFRLFVGPEVSKDAKCKSENISSFCFIESIFVRLMNDNNWNLTFLSRFSPS